MTSSTLPDAQPRFDQAYFSPFGQQVIENLVRAYQARIPALLLGGTGWGKSKLCRAVADRLGIQYSAINAHPGMNMSDMVGMWRPEPTPNGVSVVWQNGVLSTSIDRGDLFLWEELTRSPMEAVSRLFGVLDDGFRYWPMPEAGIDKMSVHENFWLIATANPQGGGYTTVRVDPALMRRFGYIDIVNKPLADERKVLNGILGDEPLTERFLRFSVDARRSAPVNTGDLVLAARMTAIGFHPTEAISYSVAPKYGEQADAIATIGKAQFETWKQGGTS